LRLPALFLVTDSKPSELHLPERPQMLAVVFDVAISISEEGATLVAE